LDFLKRIKNEILIIDGATGTLLLDKGVKPGAPLEELNVSNPDLIRSIHKSYVDAGADIIETNNFGGNRVKLSESGLQDKVRELNSQGVILAKEAAGGKALVAGNIGPTGKLLRPMGEISFDEAYDAFAEQAKIIEEAGADLISVETMTDILELKAAVMAARENTKLPVIAQMTFEDNGIAVTGTPPEAFVLIAESAGADVIGANCSNGPEILLPVMKKIAKHATKPLVVMPNAGFPELVDDRAIYKMTPEVFAQFSEKFIKMGVNIIGGCCGTRPEHIRELVNRKSTSGICEQDEGRFVFRENIGDWRED
jgi:5-methyltetrahydrofolate--homocysteine methyltransferase